MLNQLQGMPMAWANFILSIVVIAASLYFILRGRKLDRPIMVLNLSAAILVLFGYAIFLFDQCCWDIVNDSNYRAHFFRPMTFFILFVLLANILRYGKKHNDD